MRERLDKVLANASALELLAERKVVNLPCVYSDHHPLLFNAEMIPPPPSIVRPFRFQAAWITHKDFDMVFRGACENGVYLLESISVTKEQLQVWNS